MPITIKQIKKDGDMRKMYLEAFIHGTSGLPKQIPSYLKDVYLLGYNHGSKGKLEIFFDVQDEGMKNFKISKPLTRK